MDLHGRMRSAKANRPPRLGRIERQLRQTARRVSPAVTEVWAPIACPPWDMEPLTVYGRGSFWP